MNIKRAGIILNHNDAYLLVKSMKNKKWSFPKGRIESNETQLECALRELEEETGIKINTEKEVYITSRIYGNTIYFLYNSVRDIFDKKFIYDKREISDVDWFTSNDLKKLENYSYNYGIEMFISEFILWRKKKDKLSTPTDKDGWITVV